ncbi:MAG: hypothetical protein AB8B96_03060 [Lysobacterales bacterium]
MTDPTQSHPESPVFRRPFGIVLLAGAAGTVFFMAHHPTSMTELEGIAGMVHGVMLVMLLLLTSGLSHFALALGVHRLPVLLGLLSYIASAIFNSLAAVINGFVAPALAARGEDVISHDIFDLTWDTNQALAAIAVVGTGLAYVLWSVDLAKRRWFWIAGLGFLAGLAPLIVLFFSGGEMEVRTAMAVYSTQVIWAAVIGWVMFRQSAAR